MKRFLSGVVGVILVFATWVALGYAMYATEALTNPRLTVRDKVLGLAIMLPLLGGSGYFAFRRLRSAFTGSN